MITKNVIVLVVALALVGIAALFISREKNQAPSNLITPLQTPRISTSSTPVHTSPPVVSPRGTESSTPTPSVSPSPSKTPGSPTPTATATPAPTAAPHTHEDVIISYTSAGFSPSSVTIHSGMKIVFKNNSEVAIWPASNNHPTHTQYPGSNIDKCETAAASLLFDACKPIEAGQSWSFTFSQQGTWGYHNHLNPERGGTIKVEAQ